MVTLLLSALLQGSTMQPAASHQPPSSRQIDRAEQYFAQTGGQAFLVMYRGRVLREAYRDGGAADRRQMLASGSKSFVGVATIAAVQEGLLRLDAPVAQYVPEWRSDPRKARVTLRQLLSLESGIQTGNPGTGCGGRGATWADALKAPAEAEPGTVFRYGPFPFISAGAVIEQVQRASFEQFLQQRVLDRLGVQVEWRAKCGDGNPQLAGGAAMTARDWATFGEMIRRGGEHNGVRILDGQLVRELFRPAESNPNYGLSWWLVGAALQRMPTRGPDQNAAGSGRPRLRDRLGRGSRGRIGSREIPTTNGEQGLPGWMPSDLVMAAGAGDQRLYVIPSHELVVVRMGPLLRRGGFDDRAFLEALLAP
ncbi:serine hydrolase domain-containing protein [Gemmatimonas sp.]